MCTYLLQLAFQRGCITAEERSRVFGVMRQLGLALWHEVCTLDVLMQVLQPFSAVSCSTYHGLLPLCVLLCVVIEVMLCIPLTMLVILDCLFQGLEDTTRQRDGIQRVPFMNGIGEAVFVNDIQREEVAQAAEYVSALHQEQLAEAAQNNGFLANSITPLEPVPDSVKQYIREPALSH